MKRATWGISFLCIMRAFAGDYGSFALDDLTMPGERKWIPKVLDPAIKAAESTL